ncbi:hypothetical protein BY996DRAFT_4577335 [Phakopsora pachyrhizi]|uniref:Expressed protein n=1 Tax=Phakopsora pachyrhizi TaxID=170000 RepID=A0AAV0ADW6_PHAPC|nr:hypothetical protein BY996DRAFT_4577335 [Phakopsora pachyrhizi]CAH7666229.1 expressed protein [Phakopsora pachyrhizi]
MRIVTISNDQPDSEQLQLSSSFNTNSNTTNINIDRSSTDLTQFPSYESLQQHQNQQQSTQSSSSPVSPSSPSSSTSIRSIRRSINLFSSNLINSTNSDPDPNPTTTTTTTISTVGNPTNTSLINKLSIPLISPSLSLIAPQLALAIVNNLGFRLLKAFRLSSLSSNLISISIPLISILIPIIVAIRSDLDRFNTHRRRSWILVSSVLLCLSLTTLSLSPQIAQFLSFLTAADYGDWDPHRYSNSLRLTVPIVATAVLMVNLSIHALQISIQSLIIDSFSADNQFSVNACSIRSLNLANVLVFGSLYSLSDYHTPGRGGSSSSFLPSEISQPIHQLRILLLFSIPLIVLTTSITYLKNSERAPFLNSLEDDQSRSAIRRRKTSLVSRLLVNLRSFRQTLVDLPVPITRLCGFQVLNSVLWITILYCSRPIVVRLAILDSLSKDGKRLVDESLIRYANGCGFKAMLYFSLASLISAFVVPGLCSIGKTRFVSSRRGKRWNWIRRSVIANLTPRKLWTASFGIYGLLIICSFGIQTERGITVLLSLLGICCMIAQWVPISLLMEYTRSIEETKMINMPIIEEASHFTSSRHPSTSETGPGLQSKPGSYKDTNRPTEQSILGRIVNGDELLGNSNDLVDRLVSCRKYPTIHGGRILSIFNLATAIPLLVITALSSITYEILELLEGDKKTLKQEIKEQTEELLLVTRLIGVLSLFVFCFMIVDYKDRAIVVPTSELEYWDELNYQIYENEVEDGVEEEDEDEEDEEEGDSGGYFGGMR